MIAIIVICTIVTPFFKGNFYGSYIKLISCILCCGTYEINHGWPWFISNAPWHRMPLNGFLATKSHYEMFQSLPAYIKEPTALACMWYLVLHGVNSA